MYCMGNNMSILCHEKNLKLKYEVWVQNEKGWQFSSSTCHYWKELHICLCWVSVTDVARNTLLLLHNDTKEIIIMPEFMKVLWVWHCSLAPLWKITGHRSVKHSMNITVQAGVPWFKYWENVGHSQYLLELIKIECNTVNSF